MGILNIGVGGINAAQTGLLTASHNISNAATPGYSRQEIVQAANVHLYTGAGFVGQGTHVVTIKRNYDDFLGRQVLSAEAGAAEMDSYLTNISQIDNMLADSDSGMAPAMAAFFNGIQDVAANPGSIAGRQTMLSAAQALTARFQALDRRLTEIRDGANQQVATQITQINTYSSRIADVNQRIILAQTSGANQLPNDLLDQRDQMLKELNKLVRISTVTQGDGSYNVFIGAGQPLVVGTRTFTLEAVNSLDDPERITVGVTGSSGSSQAIPESQLSGGGLGGVLRFRSQSLDEAQNALGRIAITLAQNFNDQHRLGQDLSGNLGQSMFSLASPRVIANTLSGTPAVVIDGATVSQLTTSDYQLGFVGGNYQVTRLADNQVQTFLTLPQTVDGITIAVGTWVPNPGDTVFIQPTRQGARNVSMMFADTRQVAAAAPIRSSGALANTGTGAIGAGTVNGPPPANANLQHKVSITFTSATTFDVLDVTAAALVTGVAYVSGAAITYNGWTTQITGIPAIGDVFTVDSNVNGIGDNRNAALLGALQTRNTMNASAGFGPSASYQAAYAQIVSSVGGKANEVEAIGAAQQGLADQASQALQSVSGVNLDEEAANLMRYQQAYQASAKVLEIAGKIFDEILAIGR